MRRLVLISLIMYILFFNIGFYSYNHMDFNCNSSFFNFNIKTEDILKNNLLVVVQLLTGAFLFGSITILNLCYNSLYFGYSVASYITNRVPLKSILLLTLPHGIFEIPAIIIAGAAGFKIPCEIIRYLAGKKEQILTKEDIKEYLTMVLISIILIVIAAWIEANVTLKIAKAMLKSKGI